MAMAPVHGRPDEARRVGHRPTSVAPFDAANVAGRGARSGAPDAAGPLGESPAAPDAPASPLRGTALKRFNRAARRAARQTGREIVFVLENVTYPVNVGSLFRIADGCGAAVVLAGTTPDPTTPTAAKVARGHHDHVGWRRAADAVAAVDALKADGWWVAALELTADSLPYHVVDYPRRVALVLGNEDHGVTRRTLAACDAAVYIPMLGRGASLNVHVAAAVVAYRACFPSVPSSPSA